MFKSLLNSTRHKTRLLLVRDRLLRACMCSFYEHSAIATQSCIQLLRVIQRCACFLYYDIPVDSACLEFVLNSSRNLDKFEEE